MATARGVPAHVAERALRFFQLALDGGTATATGSQPKNFVLGRKSDYTVASCLYVACRMAKTTHMLIDFADVIQVNVFVLGRSYLRLLRVLNLQMPLIDPSFYISRFAALLEFGDETQRVVTDATRLVTRFKTDWMVEGRRPAGICGACLLLAARMNHFRRSVTEIVQVVKIADVTLRKRLEEFKSTPSGQLTIEDFRSVWLEEESNPPAFARARAPKAKGGARALMAAGGGDTGDPPQPPPQPQPPTEAPQQLRSDIDMLAEQATEQEITSFLQQADIHAMNSDLSEQERARIERAQAGQVEAPAEPDAGPEKDEGRASASGEAPTDDLADLDEAELDSFILNEDEVKVKERVWMEFNKDYLEAALARQLKLEADQKAGIAPAPRSRKRQKPRDGTTAPTNSAAESAKQMMQQKRWSRRINYDVLNSLFPGESSKDFGAGAKSGSHDRTHALRPGTGDMDELSEDDDDDDDDESHRSKRTRTEDDWMALGGLTRQIADEDDDADYADDYENDAW